MFSELGKRLFASYKSTLLGLAVAIAVEVVSYFATGTGPSAAPPWVHILASLVLAPLLAWKDKAVKDGEINVIQLPPPKGFVHLTVMLALAAGLLLATAAKAATATPDPDAIAKAVASDPAAVQPEDPQPAPSKFGGCVGKRGNICFAPSGSITFAAINLSTKKVEAAFSAGLGYGVTINPGKWDSFGFAAHFVVDPGVQQVSATGMLKLINDYVHVGVSKGLIGDLSWRIPIAFGASF